MKVIINILFLFCEPFLDNVRIRHADHLPILSLLDHVLPPDIGWQGTLDVSPELIWQYVVLCAVPRRRRTCKRLPPKQV